MLNLKLRARDIPVISYDRSLFFVIIYTWSEIYSDPCFIRPPLWESFWDHRSGLLEPLGSTSQTRQSEMADLARRATRWVGTFPYILTPIPNLYDHSFPRYGQITFLTFRRPMTLTFDLKFWKYLSVTVYPYVICMPSFIMIGWEMAEILHFEILRKHGQTNTQTHKHTNKQTSKQTWALQYLALPLWGRGNYHFHYYKLVKRQSHQCPGPPWTDIWPIRGQIRVWSGVIRDSPWWSCMVRHGPAWSGTPPQRF